MLKTRRTLLLSYVYYPPIGHALEALKFTIGLHESNPDLDICVALNKYTPIELVKGCPWIKRVYPIDLDQVMQDGEDAECLKSIPKEWDYLLIGRRFETERFGDSRIEDERKMFCYLNVFDKIVHARRGNGIVHNPTKFPTGLNYKRTKLTLKIPKTASEFAKRYDYKGMKICLLLAGNSGGPRIYPSKAGWSEIIKAIKNEFPRCRIYITGVTDSPNNERTYTKGISKDAVRKLVASNSNVFDCYDIGFWNQIALLHTCNVLIAPHTGFGFLASCVGTPWLVISGGNWPEYFFNQFPFYSLLPDYKDYPRLGKGDKVNGRQIPQIISAATLRRKLPELIKAIHLLLNKRFTFEKAIRVREANIHKSGFDESKFNACDRNRDFY